MYASFCLLSILVYLQINLDRQNLPQLTLRVVPRPGDALFVFAGLEFDYLLDSTVLEYGVRETLIEVTPLLLPASLCQCATVSRHHCVTVSLHHCVTVTIVSVTARCWSTESGKG